jgi:ABC-2 type transport system permease protein
VTITLGETAVTPPLHRPATFGDVLRSEWTKARTVPSTRWTLIAAATLGIGLGALISAITAHQYAKQSLSAQAVWDPTPISGAGLSLAQLAIGVLGIMVITSEYSTHAIGTSLAAVPRRGRFLTAKAVVVVSLTFVVTEVTAFAAFFIGQALISGHAPTASIGQPGVFRALIGTGLYGALVVLLGLALGTILRSAAGAISVLVAIVFVLPGIGAALPASIEHTVEKYWPTQAGQQVGQVVRTAHTLPPWAGLGVLTIFVGLVMTTAFLALTRRDA